MSRLGRLWSSSIGTKVVIGLTGLALFAYLVLHLVGNLLVFAGPETFNGYAHFLISNPLIIPIELGLALVFLLHVYKTGTNWLRNRDARPVGYAKTTPAGHTSRKSLASSTMIVSGLLVLLFVVIHVKQFKFGTFYPSTADAAIRDLYRSEVEVFANPLWVAFYVVCTLLVGLHLRHGIASGLQSLGVDHPLVARRLTAAGVAAAVVIGGGMAIIPIVMYLMHRP